MSFKTSLKFFLLKDIAQPQISYSLHLMTFSPCLDVICGRRAKGQRSGRWIDQRLKFTTKYCVLICVFTDVSSLVKGTVSVHGVKLCGPNQ